MEKKIFVITLNKIVISFSSFHWYMLLKILFAKLRQKEERFSNQSNDIKMSF